MKRALRARSRWSLHAILRDAFQMDRDRRFRDAEGYYATLANFLEVSSISQGRCSLAFHGAIGRRRKLPINGTFSGSNILEIVLLDCSSQEADDDGANGTRTG